MSQATMEAPAPEARPTTRRRRKRGTSLLSRGEPMVWMTGGSLALCLVMIAGLLAIVLYRGGRTFWPLPVVEIELVDGSRLIGEVVEEEEYTPEDYVLEGLSDEVRADLQAAGGLATRLKVRTENFEDSGVHYRWVPRFEIAKESWPTNAVLVERLKGGRFYGLLSALEVDGEAVATEPDAIWSEMDAVSYTHLRAHETG